MGKSKGTREGAIRGLIGVGKEAVRKGLVEGGGAKVVGSECAPDGGGPLVEAVMVNPHVYLLLGSSALLIYGALGCLQSVAATLRYGRNGFFRSGW